MLALSKPLNELTRVMLKKLYVTTLTILLRWHGARLDQNRSSAL
jgi:hypothetical protein